MQIRDEDLSSCFPVKTGSGQTRNSKKKRKQMEKRVLVTSYPDDESDIPSGESSDADATVSMEYADVVF